VVAGHYGADLESGRAQRWAEILAGGSPDEAIRYLDGEIVRVDNDIRGLRDIGEQFKPDTLEKMWSQYGDEMRPLLQQAEHLAVEDWQAAVKFRNEVLNPKYLDVRARMHQAGPDYVTVPPDQKTAQQLREQQMEQQQRTAAPPPPPPSARTEAPSVQPSAVDEEERRLQKQRAQSQPG